MFSIVLPETFIAPVTYQAPGNSGPTGEFDAVFRYKTQEQINELVSESKPLDDFIADVFVGWEGLTDEKDEPLEENPENREKLLNLPGMKRAIRFAYILAQAKGGPRIKN